MIAANSAAYVVTDTHVLQKKPQNPPETYDPSDLLSYFN